MHSHICMVIYGQNQIAHCYVNCNPFDDCNLQLMIVFFAINAAILLITATISLKPRENYVGLSCDRALFNYITGRTKLPPTFPIYILWERPPVLPSGITPHQTIYHQQPSSTSVQSLYGMVPFCRCPASPPPPPPSSPDKFLKRL